ncbi:MAG TPA: winged helix-turn-helix domain-containing protein [Nitrososphaerales archaeon]|nr:winged helix-turn-helix domain-containing protein [Nitrososphaerales archaeon]
MNEVNWSSLHKILSDTTRRSILELLAEKEALGYTEIMTVLGVTNTGRLNYHLKVLGDLVSKDDQGRYRLTERGQLAVNLLKTFPERVPTENRRPSALKIVACVLMVLVGIALLTNPFLYGNLGQHVLTTSSSWVSVQNQLIPQNMTVSLTDWLIPQDPSTLNISWTATSPVHIYVLNATQYGSLLLQHPMPSIQPPSDLSSTGTDNFTGTPGAWVSQYYLQAGNVSVTLPNGTYYIFAGSSGQRVVLDTFEIPQYTQTVSGISTYAYVALPLDLGLGSLLIVLAWSIATRRLWR